MFYFYTLAAMTVINIMVSFPWGIQTSLKDAAITIFFSNLFSINMSLLEYEDIVSDEDFSDEDFSDEESIASDNTGEEEESITSEDTGADTSSNAMDSGESDVSGGSGDDATRTYVSDEVLGGYQPGDWSYDIPGDLEHDASQGHSLFRPIEGSTDVRVSRSVIEWVLAILQLPPPTLSSPYSECLTPPNLNGEGESSN